MDEVKDFFASNDKKENLNSTFSSTTKRLSILKPMPDDFAFEDTRMRKARRVSFAEKIQIKTIDESLHDASKKENDEILKANTEYNSKTQTKKMVLFDVSNKQSQLNVESKMDQNEPVRRAEDTSCDMDIDDGNSIVSIQMDDDESTLLQISTNNTIDCSMSIVTVVNDTAMSMDSPPRLNDKQTAPSSQANVTYESLDIKSTTQGNICSLTQTIDMGNQTGDNLHINGTLHMSNKTMNSLVEPSILQQNNLTRTICKDTDDIEASQVAEAVLNGTRTISSQPAINRTFDVSMQLTQNYPKESFYEEKSVCKPHAVPTLAPNILNNTSILNTTNNTTATNLSLMAKIQYMEKNEAYLDAGTNSRQQAFESLKSRLLAEMAKFKTQTVKFKELEKSTSDEYESLQNDIGMFKAQLAKLKTKKREKLDEINRLTVNTFKTYPNTSLYDFKASDFEKKQKEVQQIKIENEKIQRDFEQKKKNYELMKEKLEDNLDVIKSLQRERDQKEKLKNLFEQMFSEKNIPFQLAYFTSDCIVLLVFNDLIQVEIKGTNLVKDLNVKLSLQDLNDVAELDKQQKNLNYPLESICVKTNIDSNGNFTLPMHGNHNVPVNNLNSSFFKHKKKIPAHIKYCVELILGEIGVGDIVASKKKYKYLRDLPNFIAHLNLTCKYASKLAVDLEYITAKTAGTLFKFEFDFRKFIVSAVLPSIETHCFYRLNMSVKPGCYYQQPITYTIDQNDLDEPFEPNVERIRNTIENRSFEDGSIRSYLKDLIDF